MDQAVYLPNAVPISLRGKHRTSGRPKSQGSSRNGNSGTHGGKRNKATESAKSKQRNEIGRRKATFHNLEALIEAMKGRDRLEAVRAAAASQRIQSDFKAGTGRSNH